MTNNTAIYRLQVFEHQALRIGTVINGVLFSKDIAQSLALYHEKHSGKYYQLVYQGVKFGQYVGIIQIGNLSIEILPKIDRLATEGTNNWQSVLMDMLQYCSILKADSLGFGHVQLTSNTILDIYFRLFLLKVQQLLKEGLPQKYLPLETNSKQLKGSLVLPKHLRYNSFHSERFFVRYQSLQKQHLLNQIIYEALKVLKGIYLKREIQLLLMSVLSVFPKLSPYDWTHQDFARLFQDKRNQAYYSIMELAQLILMNFSSDIRYGKHQLLALLFDMNLLFEEYVYQQLKRMEGETVQVNRQLSIPFWQRRSIRPDIVLIVGGEKIVIDTKWKVLETNTPTMEDLKQIYIYCRYFKAKRGILLFPMATGQQTQIAQPFLDEEKNIHCQILFLNVLDKEGKLKGAVGEELLNAILID